MLGQHGVDFPFTMLSLCRIMLSSFIIFHVVTLSCCSCLQVALKDLTSLKAILGLKSDPAIDSTSLNTDHLLVTILGLEVSDGFGTFSPRVPDDGVLHVVSDDIETGLVVDENGGCVLSERLVDAVDGAFDAELVALGVVLGGVEDLVNVSDARKASDLDLGDVLINFVSDGDGKCEKEVRAYRDGKVGVEQSLEVERLVALVADAQHGLQTILGQGDAVLQAEVVGPGLLHFLAEVVGGQAKVETDGIVAALLVAGL
jgi:hypothetical protein